MELGLWFYGILFQRVIYKKPVVHFLKAQNDYDSST